MLDECARSGGCANAGRQHSTTYLPRHGTRSAPTPTKAGCPPPPPASPRRDSLVERALSKPCTEIADGYFQAVQDIDPQVGG